MSDLVSPKQYLRDDLIVRGSDDAGEGGKDEDEGQGAGESDGGLRRANLA